MVTALRRRLLPYCAALAVVMLGGAAAAQNAIEEEGIAELVAGLRNGTVPVKLASLECQIGFEDAEEGEVMREFIATLLDIQKEAAPAAFCDSLIQAIKAGDVGETGLLALMRGGEDPESQFEIGRVLRIVFFAHERATLAAAPEAWR